MRNDKNGKEWLVLNKLAYDNPIRRQVLSLPDLLEAQLESCFSGDKLYELMSIAEIFDVRGIILTGAGDSFAAAGAARSVLEKYCEVFYCNAVNSMEFTRVMTGKDVGAGSPGSPLVIAISANGGTARVVEVLQKATELGAFPILITNNPESRAAKAAKRVFVMDTPKMENDFPGLRSYFASLIGLFSIACRMGHVKGVLPPIAPISFQEAIRDYIMRLKPYLEEIDNQMFELAQKWHKFERFDFIGDDQGLYSALFGLEKFVECNGAHCAYDDSEGWCHVNFFLKDPESVGTVVFADKNRKSFSRIQETVWSACEIGRPTLVITNADRLLFDKRAEVCEIPVAKPGYEWLSVLAEYVPASLLAGFCAALDGRRFFHGFDTKTNTWDRSVRHFNDGVSTMSNSKIEIHT